MFAEGSISFSNGFLGVFLGLFRWNLYVTCTVRAVPSSFPRTWWCFVGGVDVFRVALKFVPCPSSSSRIHIVGWDHSSVDRWETRSTCAFRMGSSRPFDWGRVRDMPGSGQGSVGQAGIHRFLCRTCTRWTSLGEQGMTLSCGAHQRPTRHGQGSQDDFLGHASQETW